MTVEATGYSIDCTGDVVTGDEILFTEGVFVGPPRNADFIGERQIKARVLKDSYGGKKQQHTFTLQILDSTGTHALEPGQKKTRKGRKIYRKGTYRKPWHDENRRQEALKEKHERGEVARIHRQIRKFGSDDDLDEPPRPFGV